MSELILIMLIIGITVLALSIILTFVVWKKKKEGKYEEPDYRTFFILGICFLPIGIPLMIATKNPGLLGLSAMGAIYLIIGLANRDKWKAK